jgi:HPt (histidine-containing phosphotransfer) domain-containing protein
MQASLNATATQPVNALESAFRAVWNEHREGLSARISLIERAVAALAGDELDERLRADAQSSAHMLSGSLGMFGFTRAAEAARELQLQLAEAAPTRAPALSELVAIVRRVLGPEPAGQPPAGSSDINCATRVASSAGVNGLCSTPTLGSFWPVVKR